MGDLSGILLALSVQVALLVAAFDGFAFVVFAFSFGNGDDDFDFAVFEVEAQRNQGVAFFVDFGIKPFDFMLVQQEFALTQGVVITIVCKRVGADMQVVDENLTICNRGVGIFEVCPTLPQGLYFRTNQDHTGLVFIGDKVIEAGLAVFGDYFFVFFFQFI